ncbi:MAG TPA: thiol peroxidase [Candidatus Eremiobacteraceae bacterium]|nr:thiol peroxidase [Candidatus Eremiobacteraceae bacterium]
MPVDIAPERSGVITWKGAPVTLQGHAVSAGDKAPDFRLSGGDLSEVRLADVLDGGKRAVMFLVVPSLDTGVCSTETNKFSKRVDALPSDYIKTYAVSLDLPFAQKRWCSAETVENIGMLSDYRDHSFGYAYGVRAKEKGLLARAIIVIGRDGIVRYMQLVPDATSEPDYEAAMAAAKAAVDA